jgi:hypothetical protein
MTVELSSAVEDEALLVFSKVVSPRFSKFHPTFSNNTVIAWAVDGRMAGDNGIASFDKSADAIADSDQRL